MSKFTIVVVAGDGFEASDLDDATVTLSGMNSVGEFTAPNPTVIATGTTTVKMYGNAKVTPDAAMPYRTYEAVVVPLTDISSNSLLATITNLGGNDYKINMSDGIRNSWKSELSSNMTKSGVNYKLIVTLNKQTVNVVASLANWTDVSATGTGEIQFAADVTDSGKSNDASLKNGDSFSLWMTKDITNLGSIATTITFNGTKFENSPAIYWPNGSDSYYFRALSGITGTDVKLGDDVLWGTTAVHTGYDEGAAINPRTGDVPLIFRHVMSNVVINLTTTKNGSKVDLDGAKVTLTKLYTGGKIDIASGVITSAATKTEMALNESTSVGNLFMLPQIIDDETKLIITLSDTTTYSLQLNKCTDDDNAPITNWTGGNKYTYTINLAKEAVKFRALVESWKDNPGSGDATLDWD